MSEMDFERPSSGVHQDLVNILGMVLAVVDRCSSVVVDRCSHVAVDRLHFVVVVLSDPKSGVDRCSADDIDRCSAVDVGQHQYELPMDMQLSTRKASPSSFSCSSTSPKSSSEMALTWCLSLSTAFPLTIASYFFTASAV
ncbi:hypothetical protein F2Q70_00043213 [Brassica cretica]|nr:hypothetical protein F2Q70_00043213 [Brassica cretica]KAF3521241.1 hypothetical protein DY000_02060096 [Brassica cretica]